MRGYLPVEQGKSPGIAGLLHPLFERYIVRYRQLVKVVAVPVEIGLPILSRSDDNIEPAGLQGVPPRYPVCQNPSSLLSMTTSASLLYVNLFLPGSKLPLMLVADAGREVR